VICFWRISAYPHGFLVFLGEDEVFVECQIFCPLRAKKCDYVHHSCKCEPSLSEFKNDKIDRITF